MKISKLFHWLYSLVMFLPVLFIPIMAIYSHRHTIDSYSVVRAENVITQYHFENEFNNVDTSWSSTMDVDDLYYDYLIDGRYCGIVGGQPTDNVGYETLCLGLENNDLFYFRTTFINDINSDINLHFSLSDTNDLIFEDYTLEANGTLLIDYFGTYSFSQFGLYINFDYYCDYHNQVYFQPVCVFNLTDIFGSSNLPSSIDECRDLFNQWYYQYNVDYVLNVPNVVNVTYNDTDIGSQFVYDTYNVVNKYFNYDKVFNFADLYTWLQNTFFSGNAPLGFFIFWHLLIYWLLTSLLWLLFDVLMYVPQLIHRWLDKASVS